MPQREIMLFIGKPKGRSKMVSNATDLLTFPIFAPHVNDVAHAQTHATKQNHRSRRLMIFWMKFVVWFPPMVKRGWEDNPRAGIMEAL